MTWAVVAFLFSSTVWVQAVSEYNVPADIGGCVHAWTPSYVLSGRINPFYLRGDFDGDGQQDYAALLTKKLTDEKGVGICWGGARRSVVLGAGEMFHNMTKLDFDAWAVITRSRVRKGAGEGPVPQMKGDGILIVWEEQASAVVYWDGRRFRWYQQGN